MQASLLVQEVPEEGPQEGYPHLHRQQRVRGGGGRIVKYLASHRYTRTFCGLSLVLTHFSGNPRPLIKGMVRNY